MHGLAGLGKGSDERKADSVSRFCDARALTSCGLAYPGAVRRGLAWWGKGSEGQFNED